MTRSPVGPAGGRADLAKLRPLVSKNPARAAGLADRGTLAPGVRLHN